MELECLAKMQKWRHKSECPFSYLRLYMQRRALIDKCRIRV